MRVVVAPDKFKGCLRAPQVAAAIAEGLRRADSGVEIDLCPVADGGEGTVDALVSATGGRLITQSVMGPLPHMRVDATFGMLGDGRTAVVEMAAASGLHLLAQADRDPMAATTFGTGQLLVAAARAGAKRIILGIGGSATVDAGIGCAQGAGLSVILSDREIPSDSEPLSGRDLGRVLLVKRGRGSPVDQVAITVACDVTNPLFGASGAAAVFGPQKGATPAQVRELDAELERLAVRLGRLDEANRPGAGAAGGLGFGAIVFFIAELRPGIEIVLEATRLRDRLNGAALCVTGEGRLDAQSLAGKAPVGVARLCKELGVPCVALAGAVEMDDRRRLLEDFIAIRAISDGVEMERSIGEAPRLLAEAAQSVLGEFRARREK